MTDDRDAWRPRRKWRRHRYFKVQHYEERSKTWFDFKPAFDDLAEARHFAAGNSGLGKKLRIMWVEGKSRGVLEEIGGAGTDR
jgi:hypothetical protein